MEWVRGAFRWVHVTGCFVGLVWYWVPIQRKKASALHQPIGTVWVGMGANDHGIVWAVDVPAAIIGCR